MPAIGADFIFGICNLNPDELLKVQVVRWMAASPPILLICRILNAHVRFRGCLTARTAQRMHASSILPMQRLFFFAAHLFLVDGSCILAGNVIGDRVLAGICLVVIDVGFLALQCSILWGKNAKNTVCLATPVESLFHLGEVFRCPWIIPPYLPR